MEHKAKFLYDALEVFKDMVQKGECSKQDISYWCSVSGYELERRGASVGQQRWLTKEESSKMLNVSTSTFDRIVLAELDTTFRDQQRTNERLDNLENKLDEIFKFVKQKN